MASNIKVFTKSIALLQELKRYKYNISTKIIPIRERDTVWELLLSTEGIMWWNSLSEEDKAYIIEE